ncbi:sensor histidine kinase [Isoptericola sp. NPDC057559]|uniref:sensor histidine kinase n=1 Tax=Isoptericola sp. NPDC057559 TaxID=3346168 RepID=UPI0036A39C08
MLDALRRRLDALGVRTATGRDALLGGVVAVLSVALFLAVLRVVSSGLGETFGASASVGAMSTGATVATCVVLVGQSMALTLRRRWPVLCLALTLLGQLVLVPLLPPFVSFQGPAALVAAYSAGVYAPRRPALGAAAGTAVAQVLLGFVLGGPATAAELGVPVGTQLWGGLVSALVTYVGAALVGAYVGTRRELLAELRARVAQAEREREALAAQAVLAERGRMARELHDVAAHHLSGIVVQAAAAERLVDGDPERARESLRWIRAQGRETLENLRLVVGILRDTGDRGEDAPSAPQPTLADVPALLDLARSTGTRVQETRRGEPFELPPTAQLTVYRVLQESLANARRHAPGSAVDVETTYDEDAMELTVRNGRGDPSSAATQVDDEVPGHGVIGMTERAELVGGRLSARRTSGGGWQVRLTVPRPEGVTTGASRAGQGAR